MGIKSLAKLLSDEAPDSIREVDLKSLHGRKIAVDASMAIYQFLIAVRSNGGGGGGASQQAFMLTNEEGETTSHIQGMFNRTIRYMAEGIKPVYVFDGKPPQIKSGELRKRRDRREKAAAALQVASEEGNVAELDKQSKRMVRAGHKENVDCQRLLTLMGVPVVQAPCEAEAQASALAKSGLVYAAGTEDMDALTFQTPVLIRKMTFASAGKALVQQIHYDKAIAGLQLTHEQFVDLCILLGCDYCDTIKGVGPKTALKLVREHGNIEAILKKIDRKKFVVPESWIPNEGAGREKENNGFMKNDDDSERDEEEDGIDLASKERKGNAEGCDDGQVGEAGEDLIPAFVQARRLFLHHDVLPADQVDLKWKECDADGLTRFLVDEMGFNPDRVRGSIEKLQAAHKANSKPQTRMDAFFQMKPATAAAGNGIANNNNKRKNAVVSSSSKSAKVKGGGRRR